MIPAPFPRQALKILVLMLLVVIGLGLWQSGSVNGLEPDTLAGRIDGYGKWGPIALMGVMALAVLIGPIPTFPVTIASGLAFGPVGGVCYSVLGTLLGAIIAFYIARFVGREWTARFMRGHVSFCGACSDRLQGKGQDKSGYFPDPGRKLKLVFDLMAVFTQPFGQIRLFELPLGAFQKHNDPVRREGRQSVSA